MRVIFVLIVLFFSGRALGESEALDDFVLRNVLKPWVSKNLPSYRYAGADITTDSPFTWRFVQDDKLETFPLDIELDFCLTEWTAKTYMHCYDWSLVGVPNTGAAPSHIGDDSEVFDIQRTFQGRDGKAVGGWVRCRVGTCFIFVRSYSVAIEAMKDLTSRIAEAVPSLPEASKKRRAASESKFRRAIAESFEEQQRSKQMPYKERLPYPLGAPIEEKKR